MPVWAVCLLSILGGFIAGAIAGYLVTRYHVNKYHKNNPPISEKAIRAMFRSMGRNASEAQIKQVMRSMQEADK